MRPGYFYTPPPVPQGQVHPECGQPWGNPVASPLDTMALHDKAELRNAAQRAKAVYPGPVGELVAREIMAWEDFGHALNPGGPMMDVVRQVLSTPIPVEESAA